jgi:hypothetical protein
MNQFERGVSLLKGLSEEKENAETPDREIYSEREQEPICDQF